MFALGAMMLIWERPAHFAAQLSTDARSAVPHDVQQLVVIDYRAMQNSAAAGNLRDRLMPAELKPFDETLRKSGLNENHDVEQLAFALFRTKDSTDTLTTVGIAQGQFPVQEITASLRKRGVKGTVVRTNRIYPDGQNRDGSELRRCLDDGLRHA